MTLLKNALNCGALALTSAWVLHGLALSADAQWTPPSWQAQRLGFTDSVHTREDGQQQGIVRGANLGRDGLVVGVSERYAGAEFTGSSAWASSRSQPIRRVGFFDAVHTGPGGRQDSDLGAGVATSVARSGVNALGQTVGTSVRFDPSGASGRSAWIWDPVAGTRRVGLIGAEFVGPNGEQDSKPVAFDDSGRVVGFSRAYDIASPDVQLFGVIPAAEAWTWTPGTGTEPIGLAGNEFVRSSDGFRRQEPRWMNNRGLVVGVAVRFDSNDLYAGQAAWAWTPGLGARRIGPLGARFTGSDLTQYAYVNRPTALGDVPGASWTFDGFPGEVGRQAWVLQAGAPEPTLLGLTGVEHTRDDGFRRSEPLTSSFAEPLRISGYSQLYLDLGGFFDGRSAWSWTPTEGTIEIGLRDAEHVGPDGQRDSFGIFQLSSGAIAGLSNRYNGELFPLGGQTPWVWTPPTPLDPQGRTVRLGISDALHTSAEGIQRSEIYGVNDLGLIFGVSYRFNGRSNSDFSVGRTAWVYDLNSARQTSLVFSQSSTGDAVALPLGSSDNGTIFGSYLEYDGTAIVAQRAFVWSAQRGLATVNSLLQGGPGAFGIENAFFTDTLDERAGAGLIYAMPSGVIWTPAGSGWATAYRLTRSTGSTPCSGDYNRDDVLNTDDVSDFITDYFTAPAVPGLEGAALSCPGAPTPYDTRGYRADVNADCVVNTDDVSDFITAYFQGC